MSSVEKMDIDFMKSFGKAAEFYVRGGPLYVQSVCFSRCGQYMASSHTNNILTIINVDVGEIGGQDQYCHKYGTGIVRYPAQLKNRVLLTSTQTDDSVRELDLERSEYSRVFKGHTKTVLSLETSANDAFVTSSEDGTVRLWDTRSQRVRDVIGELRQPVANISAAGNTIIVGNDSETIQLYDVRMLQQGLFRDFRVPTNLHSKWASVEVSNDDRLVAVATNDHFVHMANMDNNDVHTFRSEYSYKAAAHFFLLFKVGSRRVSCGCSVCLAVFCFQAVTIRKR